MENLKHHSLLKGPMLTKALIAPTASIDNYNSKILTFPQWMYVPIWLLLPFYLFLSVWAWADASSVHSTSYCIGSSSTNSSTTCSRYRTFFPNFFLTWCADIVSIQCKPKQSYQWTKQMIKIQVVVKNNWVFETINDWMSEQYPLT